MEGFFSRKREFFDFAQIEMANFFQPILTLIFAPNFPQMTT